MGAGENLFSARADKQVVHRLFTRRETDWLDGLGKLRVLPHEGRKSRGCGWAVCREMRGRLPNQCRCPKEHAAADVCLCTAMFVGATLVAGAGGSASAQPARVPPCSSEQQRNASKVARGCDKSDIDILSSVGGSEDSSRGALQAFSHGEGNQLRVRQAQPAADFHRDALLCWPRGCFEVRPAPAADAVSAVVQPVRMRDWGGEEHSTC